MVRTSDWLYVEIPFGLVNTAIAVGWFLHRRRMFPIYGRHLTMISLFAAIGILEIYIEDWYAFTNNYCSWIHVAGLSLSAILLNLIVVRAARLWFLFSLASEKLNMHKSVPRWEQDTNNLYDPGSNEPQAHNNPSDLRQPPPNTFFIRHRHYVSERYLWRAIFVSSFVPIAALVIGFGTFSITHQGVWDHSDDNCLPIRVARYTLWADSGLTTFLLAFLAWKIRHINDGYGIRNEILAIAVFNVGAIVLLTLTNGLEKVLLHFIPEQIQLIPMFYYPIYLSYKEQWFQERKRQEALNSKRKRHSMSFDTSLLQVLTQKEYSVERKAFEEHLVREFSIENIIFFKVTLQFERSFASMSKVKVREAALQIYLEFLVDRAPYQVNLPFGIRRDLTSDLRACFVDFDEACAEYKHRRADAGDTVNVLNIQLGVPGLPLSLTPEDLSIIEDAAVCASPERSPEDADGVRGNFIGGASTNSVDEHEEAIELKVMEPTIRTESGNTESSDGLQKDTLVTDSAGEIVDDTRVVELAEVNRLVFRRARDSILTLMESDTFARWKNQWRREQEAAAAKEDAEQEQELAASSSPKKGKAAAAREDAENDREESSACDSSDVEAQKPAVSPV